MGLSKRQKRKRIKPPRAKRMKRPARLQSAKSWLKKYDGQNVLRGYCKHFGVDWRCAAIELKVLGVQLDDAYLQRRENTERNKSLKRKATKDERALDEALHERIELIEMIHGEFHDIYLHDPGLDAFLGADTEVESRHSPNEDRSIPF